MKLKTISLLSLLIIFSLSTSSRLCLAKTPSPDTTYQEMSLVQRKAFVAEKAREISRQISGGDYDFSPAYISEIQKAVDFYAQRIGNNAGETAGRGDAKFAFERGEIVAPKLSKAFKTHNLSPLIGLYIPMVESEYTNISSPNAMGAVGMFQFVPATGARYGLSAEDLLDVDKSADAAARYITDSINQFSSDRMKEALALLAYNRGGQAVERDLAALLNDQNRSCSICVLTEQRDKLDKSFRNESVYYVPRWFAGAIVGENPQAFGLKTRPLSSL